MKRVIASTSRGDKAKLKAEFIQIASQIKDMGKYELAELLDNGDIETASEWIDQIRGFYMNLQDQANSVIQHYIVEVTVNGKFFGYVKKCRYYSPVRSEDGTVRVSITLDADEALRFASKKEVSANLKPNSDIIACNYEDNIGYTYSNRFNDPKEVGQLDIAETDISEVDVYHAGSIKFDPIEI